MTPLEIVRAACIKANPEIMELKFGCILQDSEYDKCFLMHNENGNLIVYAWTGDIHAFPMEMGSMSDEERKRYRIKRFKKNEEGLYDDFKILGRPIRLADVFYAMSKKGDDGLTMADSWGCRVSNHDVTILLNMGWNLLHDDLSLQSPECLEFLSKILCPQE